MNETCALFNQARWCKICRHCIDYVETPRFMAGCDLERCEYTEKPKKINQSLTDILDRMNAIIGIPDKTGGI